MIYICIYVHNYEVVACLEIRENRRQRDEREGSQWSRVQLSGQRQGSSMSKTRRRRFRGAREVWADRLCADHLVYHAQIHAACPGELQASVKGMSVKQDDEADKSRGCRGYDLRCCGTQG